MIALTFFVAWCCVVLAVFSFLAVPVFVYTDSSAAAAAWSGLGCLALACILFCLAECTRLLRRLLREASYREV